MTTISAYKDACRKWIGVIWLTLEVNLVAGTIFGFAALFKVLPKYGVYSHYCTSASNTTAAAAAALVNCGAQTREYQNALTLGIAFFGLPSALVGGLIDKLGCRFTKLIGVVFHVVGWLALALVQSGRDYLLYIHTVFSSIGGIAVLISTFASSEYFATSRAVISALFAGATISSTMWFSIFQRLIDDGHATIGHLSYIWMSFGVLLFVSAFLFLDWKFTLCKLPYGTNVTFEEALTKSNNRTDSETKWYIKIYQRTGIWNHLLSPLYILVVLFLSVLLLPSVLLSVIWYPWVHYITNQDTVLANQYTFAFNVSTLSALAICPINGFILGRNAMKNRKQQLLNILIVQTISWISNVALCIICMFVTLNVIIPALVINCIARSTIVAGSQAVVATFFPSEYIGRLTGIMWTVGGAVTFIQYALVLLTDDISKSWRVRTFLNLSLDMKIKIPFLLGLGNCAGISDDHVLSFGTDIAKNIQERAA
ncbi:unnamed protein product [Adineta ricciae]|uniref:Uncharacterized protein n=1 Tax=Adineta ricciae TaxID=249248 RepID=A0A815C7C6_ADIRI|nr:unnamed protein product [Adineta ricciae]